jgi:hypothetical protein
VNIPPYVFHRFGQKLGYECWEDPDFVDWVDREIKIRLHGRVHNGSVLMRQQPAAAATGPGDAAAGAAAATVPQGAKTPMFRKTYG